MQLTEIRIAGFGGQGVIMCASVIGRAASIVEKGYATMTQNFGPEARGGACSAQLILSPTPILYPYVVQPDLMVLMSQEAFVKFAKDIKPGGTLIVERDLVRVQGVDAPDVRVFAIPATRMAEDLGKKMVQNVVMTGFFGAISGLLQRDSLRKAVEDSVPAAFAELNRKAYDAGYEYGLKHLEEGCMELGEEDPVGVSESL
jgi:2-oxoglutarate ferredoxin oxidoreductase subunit gamma